MRLFAALPVPDDVAQAFIPLQKGLTGAAWRPVENFHVTLAFYGEVDQSLAEELDLELENAPMGGFPVEVSGVGWFGRREPHAVWARVTPSEPLSKLAGACVRAGKHLGLPMEKRTYTPHITLAYCHNTPLADAMAWAERYQPLEAGPFTADRFHLYSSQLGRGPSRYRAETEYPLG